MAELGFLIKERDLRSAISPCASQWAEPWWKVRGDIHLPEQRALDRAPEAAIFLN